MLDNGDQFQGSSEPKWVKRLKNRWWIHYLPKSAALAVASLAMLGTVFNSYENKTALFQNNRAWVGYKSIRVQGLVDDQHFLLDFTFFNSGKSPATIESSIVDDLAWIDNKPALNAFQILRAAQLPASQVQGRITCKAPPDSTIISTGEAPLFPGEPFTIGHSFSGKNIADTFKNVLDGEKVLVINGCLTYETELTIHHTRFCLVGVMPTPTQEKKINFSLCLFGNKVD